MLTFAKEYENRRVTAEETLQIMKQGYYFIDGIKISLPDNVGFAKVICIHPAQSEYILCKNVDEYLDILHQENMS